GVWSCPVLRDVDVVQVVVNHEVEPGGQALLAGHVLRFQREGPLVAPLTADPPVLPVQMPPEQDQPDRGRHRDGADRGQEEEIRHALGLGSATAVISSVSLALIPALARRAARLTCRRLAAVRSSRARASSRVRSACASIARVAASTALSYC